MPRLARKARQCAARGAARAVAPPATTFAPRPAAGRAGGSSLIRTAGSPPALPGIWAQTANSERGRTYQGRVIAVASYAEGRTYVVLDMDPTLTRNPRCRANAAKRLEHERKRDRDRER